MNTMVCYMYRDASNYKEAEAAVVEGDGITLEQLKACCDNSVGSEDGFIPSQVGLDDLQHRMIKFPTEDDHVWHELELIKPTTENHNVELTAEQLLKNFQLAKDKWNVKEAMVRLNMI